MDDRVDVLDGGGERGRIGEVAVDGADAVGQRDVLAHEGPARDAGVDEAGDQARADETGRAGQQERGHDDQ